GEHAIPCRSVSSFIIVFGSIDGRHKIGRALPTGVAPSAKLDALRQSPAHSCNEDRSSWAMRDVLGWRRKFGVLGPSTNTIVQPDFEMMRPIGVTNHYSRIFTPNAQAVSNETFMAGTELIGRNVLDAVRSVMTCEPDYLVMGMSAVTFYGGGAGADAFQAKVE